MEGKKILYIVRHAKSSWDLENVSDIDRPLKLRGIRNAYEMARRLKIARNIPGKFITSPANRALHTASIFLNVFELPYHKLSIEERLYAHGPQEILDVIQSQPETVNKLMIFGHNPDFSEIARVFVKNQTLVELPTCGMAIYTFRCGKWSKISRENQIAEYIDFPKKEH
jgi:phosphohistidine phosphatase